MQNEEFIIPVVAIIMGCSVAIIAIVMGNWASVNKRRRIEESRREIAAYIAEGSMTPQDGERLMNSGPESEEKD